eukprot:2686348-Pleurochrysis_carterae.AAC.1
MATHQRPSPSKAHSGAIGHTRVVERQIQRRRNLAFSRVEQIEKSAGRDRRRRSRHSRLLGSL